MIDLRVASINISGIRSIERRRLLLQFCLEGNLDLVALQEVTFHECSVLGGHYNVLSNVGPRRRGTAVLIRKGIHFSRELLDPDGRLISIDVGSFTFINIYAPSGLIAREERNIFLRQTIPAYAVSTNLPLLLVGDFNCVNEALDRSTPNPRPSPSRITNLALREMISGLELVDIWKKLKPGEPGHTFHHSNGSCRIDRVFSSRNNSEHVRNIQLKPLSISDHLSLECTILHSGTIPRSRFKNKNLWKLNTAVLSEDEFKIRITSFIESSLNHPLRENDCVKWWENIFKPGVKRVAISYCKERANLIRNTKLFYQTCILDIVNTEPLDWIAFKEFRSYSKSWEESLLQGFGVRSHSFEGPDFEKATVFHVKKTRENFRN
jgi:exonuclease III